MFKRCILILLLSLTLVGCGREKGNKEIYEVTVSDIDGDLIYCTFDDGEVYAFYGTGFAEMERISVVMENDCIIDVLRD